MKRTKRINKNALKRITYIQAMIDLSPHKYPKVKKLLLAILRKEHTKFRK